MIPEDKNLSVCGEMLLAEAHKGRQGRPRPHAGLGEPLKFVQLAVTVQVAANVSGADALHVPKKFPDRHRGERIPILGCRATHGGNRSYLKINNI